MGSSKNDIETWIASTKDSDGIDFDESDLQQDARSNWPAFMQEMRRTFLSGKTKLRTCFITERLLPLLKKSELKPEEGLDIFRALALTYPRDIDTTSRNYIEEAISRLVKSDSAVRLEVVKWIRTEAGRICEKGYSRASAASGLLILLSWCCRIYSTCVGSNTDFMSSQAWTSLLAAMAILQDSLLDHDSRAKESIRRGAIIRLRRALRSSPGNVSVFLQETLALSKASSSPFPFISLLGLGCDVVNHLKNVPEENKKLSHKLQTEIIQLYTTSVLMSKTLVPLHVAKALQGFIKSFITEEEFRTTILPTMEKASLRSPEVALPVIAEFFRVYDANMPEDLFRRLITTITNSVKSSNPSTRANAVALFKVVLGRSLGESNEEHCVNEILLPIKAGKTNGADHRQALYSMLTTIAPSPIVSKVLTENAPSLLSKEPNDEAVAMLASSLVSHFVYQLKSDMSIPQAASSLIAKEMCGTKLALRKSMCLLAGGILYDCADSKTTAFESFIEAVLPALENNLKAVLLNPHSSPNGPLEGYIALTSLLNIISLYPRFDISTYQSIVLQSIASSASKSSFLLSERIYQKLGSEEEKWLLRALPKVLVALNNEIKKNESVRQQLGLIFIHFATQGHTIEIRRMTLSILEAENIKSPHIINEIICSAMPLYISRTSEKRASASNTTEDEIDALKKGHRLIPILAACASFDDATGVLDRERLLADMLVLAHHYELCGTSRQLWVDLCQRAKVDPRELIEHQKNYLISNVMHNDVSSTARDGAVTTLCFVGPDIVIPSLLDQIKSDLDVDIFASLNEVDIAIWKTPEGVMYFDVLSSKQPKAAERKGKNAAIEKWEAELRESIASKKQSRTTQSLSKQEKELVDAQLQKEANVRQRVAAIYKNAARGLSLVISIVESGVREFSNVFSLLITFLLDGAVMHGSMLLEGNLYDTYLRLGEYCSDRLGTFCKWVGVATLRCLQPDLVPEELKEEPLHDLVLRVLYRLHSLSEQNPLDSASFAYSSPLLSYIIQNNLSGAEEEQAQEAIALTVGIVGFHSSEFADRNFPRSRTMQDLLAVIKKHPSLGKDASSALIALCEAIHLDVLPEEITILVQGTLSQEVYVRNSSLQCLQSLDLTDLDWSPELWIASYDNDQQNARIAQHIWEENGLDVPEPFFVDLQHFLDHENSCVRGSTASSLTDAASQWPAQVENILSTLYKCYQERAKNSGPEYDEYGILITRSMETSDPWPVRLAIAQSLEALASLFTESLVEPFFEFLLDGPLGDRSSEVRLGMLNAASKVIDLHGNNRLPELLSMFESHLSSASSPTESADYVKEAAVILLGRTAGHLNKDDPRIPSAVSRLIEALKTPSEQVQVAVSECLAPLVKLIRVEIPKLVADLLQLLSSAPKYGERRGAAFGIAGIIKGTGISGIKELNIIQQLHSALDDKKKYDARQGAMFAIETLSATLGRNFEPYIIELLPSLLTSFGDSVPDVREAAEDAAKVIMSNLSAYGVKRILPSLLLGLEEKQWRTKKGAIELLGTMAYCSPKQLSMSLPTVIPRLTGVLTDSHTQVRTSANRSLKQFGEVISNPEIQSLVPVLLKALVDPGKTPNALGSLLKKSFVHYIDSPSLALVMPIIERGLRERGSDAKRKAAQIVGNLASLTDSKDLIPYLSKLLPLVHVVLVDPVPEARATAAKALGTLIERLGEEQFPDMVPGLLRTLKSDTSGVDRQGAAQGLSEVLAGLGMERMEALLPDIVSNAQSPRSSVREGFMSLLVYLPATFGTRFQPHLTKIVAPILSGLSDTEEYVREAAMRAGRMIIVNYSNKAVDLLLPELEHGMFDSSWRIRHSSITLVGELLFKVSGISGKAEIEEDEEVEIVAAESSRKALGDALGKERRDRVLSALYIARQDAVSTVRQSAIHIWKVLVQNTPRTVRDVLAELVRQLIVLLVDEESPESQETASRTMGELCRKFGERILGEILPVLREASTSSDSQTREGVCLALCEIMENATDTQRGSHDDDIVAIVRASLVDDEANVRAAAAGAFDSLQEHLGAKAIDQTIPTLLEALRQPGESSGTALQALKEVMNVRANSVFPVLIPTLIGTPMTVFNARALASLVTVAGNALSKRLNQVLGALVGHLEENEDKELHEALIESITALLGSISDPEGLNTLMLLLLGWAKADNFVRRATSCKLFGIFCEESDLDDSLYRVDWIRQLVTLMDDSVESVSTAAWGALDVFVKSVPKDELEPLVVTLRRTIESTGAPGRTVPGFSLPKGVAPMVPVILAGLTTGSNEQRENAASAIGELVTRTSEPAFKPFVVALTGPLIRVAAQSTAYPPGVKSAILGALATMVAQIPAHIRPFFPQLQRTFVKAVSDASSLAVRNRAASALGVLMRSQTRVDPVVTELIGGARGAVDEAIAASHITALASVVRNAGSNVGEKARESCVELVSDAFRESHDEHYVQAVASLFASLGQFPDLLKPLVNSYLLSGTPLSILSSHTILAVLSQSQEDEAENLFSKLGALPSVAKKVQESIGSERPSIARPAREAREILNSLG